MITKFNEYITESLKDKMIGKSEDEIAYKLKDLSGRDLLIMSAKYNYLDGVKKALDMNKDDRFPKVKNSNILHVAKLGNYRDIISDINKYQAIRIATVGNNNNIVKLLINSTEISQDNKDILLKISAENNNEELVKLYIDKGANAQKVYDKLMNDSNGENVIFLDSIKKAKNLIKKYL